MAVVFRMRGVDGKFVKGDTKNIQKAVTRFGSNVIKGGRAILNQKGKRTQQNTLFNQYHYKMSSTDSTISMEFDFGDANEYWQFVDLGVEGVGYPPPPPPDKRPKNWRSRQGLARGTGSPFKFKYDSPGGLLVNAIRGWVMNKPIGLEGANINSAAWAIGYNLKRRGLERTMFYSRPMEKALKTLPDELTEAFKLDFSKLINKLPSKVLIETKK